ncbi:5561_t:CDS:1 [Funneliformis geosporum]|uniref:5561_t:CDS:1 n=1 Tax=Funneliformis geosporum TaxID=1117311 RepID=A0A9W4STP7_9GLOM|nr:5561_t:CDS:1 [Funneliformis geosporum]
MGFDNSNIIQQLLGNVIFHPFMFNLGKLNIFVLGIEKSKNLKWNYVGERYKSIFQYKFDGIRSIFIQVLKDEEYVVQIFTNSTLVRTYSDIDPDKIWLQINRLSNYPEKKFLN